MAENPQNPAANQNDLVSLDAATQPPLETGAGASSQDSILNAAEMFQQQLEQMTAWKHQLAQQMEIMRRDGVKLLDRQKTLAAEKKALGDEKNQLTAEREQLKKLQEELDGESKRLGQRAGELESAQQQLAQLQAQREQAERELSARQKSLAEQEARHLSEDVRLKEGFEQLEKQRQQLAEAHRQIKEEREKIDGQSREVEARAHQLEQQNQSLSGREQEVNSGRKQIEQAQAALHARQEELAQQQSQLQAKLAEAQHAQQHLAEERQAVAKHRQEFNGKLEAFEREHAEQLETLAKQTKRLSERRAEVDATEGDLEKALGNRIHQATEGLKEELNRSKQAQQERLAQIEQKLQQAESAAKSAQAKESQFQQELAAAGTQLGKLKEELRAASGSLERVSAERSSLSQQLAQQIEAATQEAAKWQQAIEAARNEAGGGEKAIKDARSETAAVRKELQAAQIKMAQIQSAKEDLEFQLEVKKEDIGKQLEGATEELNKKLKERDAQVAEWKQKFESAQAAAAKAPAGKLSGKESEKVKALAGQLEMLEQQRNDLANQLFAAQDSLKRFQEESLLAKNSMEGKLISLEQKTAALEAERARWKSQAAKPAAGGKVSPEAAKQTQWQRERLLRQAKALRTFRQQIKETQTNVTTGRDELTQQREQLRARKENLEQVKRLLEKQEMVMARKLADHNAIKTVAAVGIFVIMVLGSVFVGVYHFIYPVYRSEAVVKLAPPPDLQGQDLTTWLGSQMEYVRSKETTFAAWKVLRSNEEHYAMHDVREEWLASLGKHLSMDADASTKTLSIRYTGPNPEGVSQVCNALATAYINPGLRDSKDENKTIGVGAQVLAKATPPLFPTEDSRMSFALSVVAITLFVSLVLVMIFRHFIARQLKEIDQMADAKDLEDIQSDLPEGVKPAIE